MNTTLINGPGLEASRVTEARTSLENPNVPITAAALAEILSGGPNESGQTVTPNTAMGVSAVFACVRIISSAIARMPLLLYERTSTGRARAVDLLLFTLLSLRPNPDMPAYAWLQALVANALLWGNGYSEIVRNAFGEILELIPIESWRVTPFRHAGELRYRVSGPNGDVVLLRRDVIHLPGLSFDGICGLSVVKYARLTLGAAIAGERFDASMAGNGMRPSMWLKSPKRLTKEAAENLRISLAKLYGGPGNAGKPMILEEGLEAGQLTMPMDDAQWVEQKRLRIEECARWFGVPPHKIQDLSRSTNNNIEQQSLDFLGDCLGPWIELIHQELNWKCLTDTERPRLYIEFLTQAIILLDTNTRGQHYERMARIGAFVIDEIRQRENMDNLPDKRGTVATIPSSQIPAPTPEEATKLLEAWVKKGSSGNSPGGANPGQPNPKTDGQVAGAA